MNLSGFLGDAIDAVYSTGWLSCLLIGWITMPGMMFVVAGISERRIMPFWRGQSRAFIPGDLMLGVAFAASVYQIRLLPNDGWWSNGWYPVAVAVIAALLFMVMRLFIDAPGYDKAPGASKDCPTKWFHDIVGYLIYGTVLGVVAIPTLFSTPFSWAKVAEIVGLVVWVCGLIVDMVDSQQMIPAMMHPSDWANWADGSIIKIAASLLIDIAIMAISIWLAILV